MDTLISTINTTDAITTSSFDEFEVLLMTGDGDDDGVDGCEREAKWKCGEH
jgi:hypothetical protein